MTDNKGFPPGPWALGEQWHEEDECLINLVKGPRMLAIRGAYANVENFEEGVSNARLISAAPEMYEALQEMMAEFRALDLPYGSKAYLKASNVIAKAEGRG